MHPQRTGWSPRIRQQAAIGRRGSHPGQDTIEWVENYQSKAEHPSMLFAGMSCALLTPEGPEPGQKVPRYQVPDRMVHSALAEYGLGTPSLTGDESSENNSTALADLDRRQACESLRDCEWVSPEAIDEWLE